MSEMTRADREAALGIHGIMLAVVELLPDEKRWLDGGGQLPFGLAGYRRLNEEAYAIARARAEGAAAESRAIHGYLVAIAGSFTGASKRLLDTVAGDILRQEHKKVVL